MLRRTRPTRSWPSLIAVLGLAAASAGEAAALSCAPPSLDEAAIDGAVAIFEGIAGQTRGLEADERAALGGQGRDSLGGGPDDLEVTGFTVTRGWKGTAAGKEVDVVYNGYWGDGFAEGGTYLVVSAERAGNLIRAPLCGVGIGVAHAEKRGMIDALERVIGRGQP